jgi:rubrerythrin
MIRGKLVEVLLRSAMAFEEDSARFYRRCMERASDETIRALFRSLAEEEDRHAERLETLLATRLDEILDGETADPPAVMEPEPNASPAGQGPSGEAYRVLRAALDHEISSHNFYALLGKRSSLEVLRKTFALLAAEEEGHIRHVRRMMRELVPGPEEEEERSDR